MGRIEKREYETERNQLLKDCDFRVLPDYPDANKETWILYRHNLRILPELGAKTTHKFQLNQNK